MNKSPNNNIVAGLDIGTNKVAVCVGQLYEGMVKIIALGTAPNYGLRKGTIEDVDSVANSIIQAIRSAEQIAGAPIAEAIVGINGHHCSTHLSRGVIAISRADGCISPNDAERVLEAAKAVALPPNREIIHVFPKKFVIDNQEGVKDPVGMTGIRLEAEAHIIGGSTPALKNLERCLYQASIANAGYVFNPLATSRATLEKKQKDLGVALVDIGANTTGLAVFEEGDLIHAAVLPIGSGHLTNDIAIGLRIPIDLAEEIKLKYATASPRLVKDSEYIDLSEFSSSEKDCVPRKYLAEITEARLFEIFALIREQLQMIDKDGMLPAGIVYTGGGSLIEGLLETSKEQLRLSSQLAKPSLEFSSLVDNIDSPMYSTSIGLMLWGIENLQNKKYTNIEANLGGVVDKVRGIFKQFLP